MRSLTLLVLVAATTASPRSPTPNPPSWKVAWSDEFSGPADSPPDPTKWVHDLGHDTDGWGNHELESYTDSIENAHLDGQGHLVIRALKDGSGDYTSARLKTLSKYATVYGKIEARIKIPYGQGVWPAFWSMGADIEKVGWPNCGEIDIMENIGKEPNIQHGSLHGPGYSGGNSLTGAYTLPKGEKLSDDFHVYGIVWTGKSIQFEFDGHPYFNATPGSQWIFNKPFFLLLNLAIGGDWPGPPDNTTIFPREMLVDYVRVYK